tara:strand:- start:6431 stop:6946 length:516 start_codon:yes stop_codon:yes gene_type:complete
MTNIMKTIKIEKITLNIGAGKDQNKLNKGIKLIKNITGINPIKTITNKRIPAWNLRPGLPIGCKLTLRGKKAKEVLKQLFGAKSNEIKAGQFDENGNLSFGIHEYIDIPGIKYDPEIGIIGLQVCITLKRPGYRVNKRKIMKRKINNKHKITKQEAIDFIKKEYNVKVEGE